MFVIFYSRVLEQFILQSIYEEGDSSKVRKLVNEIYRGKDWEEMKELTNLDDVVYCNESGTLCAAKSLRSALLMAELSFL